MENKFVPVCEPLLAGNELKYITDAVSTGWISSSGGYIEKFEKAFAKYCGVKYAVAVTNGTVALHLALVSLGIGTGDEVIIPSFTMIATAFAVTYKGAVPVFVDADKDTWNIDTKKIEEKISKKTKAILPVHIFGLLCNMDAINRIARENKLFVIEDAAEAHGAESGNKKAGNFSDIAAFSFFANKNITTGEGGMIVTNSEELYKKVKYYKNMCFPVNGRRTYIHEDIGYNYRMSNLHAAIGLAQVEKADSYKKRRIENGKLYRKYLNGIDGLTFQKENKRILNVYWMNGLIINSTKYGKSRDSLVSYLKDQGVDTRLFFTGMHKQPSLIKYGCDINGDYTITEYLTENGFYLPSSSSLTESEILGICDHIKKYKDL